MRYLRELGIALAPVFCLGCAVVRASPMSAGLGHASAAETPAAIRQLTTDEDRGFAVCLSLTAAPGLPAAYLGYPFRGAANFATSLGGGGLIWLSAVNTARGESTPGLTTAGVVIIVGAFVWSVVDGASLPAKRSHRHPDLEKRLKERQVVEREAEDLLPDEYAIDDDGGNARRSEEPRVATPAPTPLPRPAQQGPVFIQTNRAGLQQVEAGRYVEVWLSSGDRVVGEITAVARHGLVLDTDHGERVFFVPDIDQVFAAKRE